MSYDALAESVRLLEGAELPAVVRLSRRVRHVPLAVDRDGDVAVTVFLRRGVSGLPLVESHTLELARGGWRVLGGGGGASDVAVAPRQSLAELGAPAVSPGSGGTARSRSGLLGLRSGWISYAELWLAREVAVLQVGNRRLPFAAHGYAVVVWTGRTPEITARDAEGKPLGAVELRTPRRMPPFYA
ncbi:hypothetical protein [Candidatus Blastococcus massiliensis]|uniref:hypothetical protein n=1 Tax=Candidatus Blastococcus massiliensis TaxID=1470358 RepID=UPI0004B7A72A|nr:hypothetical protein [Candidatus Blastococcus massiliensis]